MKIEPGTMVLLFNTADAETLLRALKSAGLIASEVTYSAKQFTGSSFSPSSLTLSLSSLISPTSSCKIVNKTEPTKQLYYNNTTVNEEHSEKSCKSIAATTKVRAAKKVVQWQDEVVEVWLEGRRVLGWQCPHTSSSLQHIERRIREGYTVEQCKLAIHGSTQEGTWFQDRGCHGINHIFSKATNLDTAIEAGVSTVRHVEEKEAEAEKKRACQICKRNGHTEEFCPERAEPPEETKRLLESLTGALTAKF